jgi:hypothetical protein
MIELEPPGITIDIAELYPTQHKRVAIRGGTVMPDSRRCTRGTLAPIVTLAGRWNHTPG